MLESKAPLGQLRHDSASASQTALRRADRISKRRQESSPTAPRGSTAKRRRLCRRTRPPRRRRDRARRRPRPARPAARPSSKQPLGEGYSRSAPAADAACAAPPSGSSRRARRSNRRVEQQRAHARPASSTPATSSSRRSTAPRRELRERAAEGDRPRTTAARRRPLLVISRYAFNSPGSIALNKRLDGDAAALGRRSGPRRPASPAARPRSTTTAR